MSENSAADSTCEGASRNCEVLLGLDEAHAERCEEACLAGPDAIVQAMAVGLVIEVWRNGPVEDMHSSRRGPGDAAMFAESVALQDEAVKALTAKHHDFGLIDFERHLLDRERPWAGTGGRTLRELGYGLLGQHDRHVKDRVGALMSLGDHSCVGDPLQVYLVPRALMYGRHHKGMPGWRVVVERVRVLLANPEHPAWRGAGRGDRAIVAMPAQVQSVDQLAATLLTNPSTLPVEVLEWLSDHLLYCAGPPYGRSKWEAGTS